MILYAFVFKNGIQIVKSAQIFWQIVVKMAKVLNNAYKLAKVTK